MTNATRKLLMAAQALNAEVEGYDAVENRAATEAGVRSAVAATLDTLRGKLADLKAAAQDEGEEDMIHELDKIDVRMERTTQALRGADTAPYTFLKAADAVAESIDSICRYDEALLADTKLLAGDVMALKYETIGNLTLREVEGTMAAIEIRVTNRADLFADSGRR